MRKQSGLNIAMNPGMTPETITAERITTWALYAAVYKQCFVKHATVAIQATRYEPAREIEEWTLFLPSPHAPVSCKNITEARSCAALFGCTIIL